MDDQLKTHLPSSKPAHSFLLLMELVLAAPQPSGCLCSLACPPLVFPVPQLLTLCPSLSRALCLSTPLCLPITWLVLPRKLSSGNLKRVTEIWGQVTAILPVTSSSGEISARFPSGDELETYSCSSWNTREIFFRVKKVKLQIKAGVEIKPSPPCQASLWLCLMLFGGSHMVCP